MAPKDKADGRVRFDEEARRTYLDSLRSGNLKYESARLAGVSYRTIQRRRTDDPEFVEEERHALAEAREGVEKVLFDMARQGDLGAIKEWLKAHDRSTYGDKQVHEIDATPAALELSQNEALGRIADLQRTIEERKRNLALDEGVVLDVESVPIAEEF
jgi:hypothetical protein